MSSARGFESEEFEALLERALAKPASEPAISGLRRAFREAAAVLGPFDPRRLRPAGSRQRGKKEGGRGSALAVLAADCDEVPPGGWMLDLCIRRRTLAALLREKRVEEAAAANPGLQDAHTRLLLELLAGKKPELRDRSLDELRELERVLAWLDGVAETPVTLEEVRQALELRKLVEPFHALAGTHFRGRREELETLRDFVEAHEASGLVEGVRRFVASTIEAWKRDPISVWGPGGIGKSTLIARFILDHAELEGTARIPYAYLDFDNSYLDPRRPETLLAATAEQLAREFPGFAFAELAERWKRTTVQARRRIPDSTARSPAQRKLHGSASKKGRSALWRRMTEALASRLEALSMELSGEEPAPFLLVLDTFEEVQIAGPAAELQIEKWLRAMGGLYPRLRVVVSGRARAKMLDARPLPLKELEEGAAAEVLEALGVEDPRLRRHIVGRVGGSPLSLYLAAEVVRRAGPAALEGVRNRGFLLQRIEAAEIQGQLYDRILKHIRDPELRKLAHPGLVLRRITAEIIAEVLAEPCGLDRARAEALFDGLRREVSLVEEAPDGALRHRSDVRRIMLRVMLRAKEYEATIREIHTRAVDWYARRSGPVARGEELYHRMMLGQGRKELEAAAGEALEPQGLERAWDDPLPPRARAWLAARLGRHTEELDWQQADLDDWEAHAAGQVSDLLAAGEPEAALKLLHERRERTLNSPLFVLEARALGMLGRAQDALRRIEESLDPVLETGDRRAARGLCEEGARLALEAGEAEQFHDYLGRALEMARDEEDAAGELALLRLRVAGLKRLGAPEAEAGRAAEELTEAFLRAPSDVLLRQQAVTGEVVAEVGAEQTPVLERAIEVMQPEAAGEEGIENLTEILQEAAAASQEFRERQSDIARQAGLRKRRKLTWSDVARRAVEFGVVDRVLTEVVRAVPHGAALSRRIRDLVAADIRLKAGF